MSFKSLLRWPLLLFLRSQARRALVEHRPLIIGVAGAVGKSSTVQAIVAALTGSRLVRSTPGNSETGVPLGILHIKQTGYGVWDWIKVFLRALFPKPRLNEIEVLVVEMGTDELTAPKNMEYLLSIVKPDIAVWLNVYAAHLSQFALGLTRAEKRLPEKEKAELLIQKIAAEDGKIISQSGCHTAIWFQDNTPIAHELKNHSALLATKKLYAFGTEPGVVLRFVSSAISLSGTTFSFERTHETITLTLPGFVLPEEYREVLAAALIAAEVCGVSLQIAVKNIMNNFSLPPGRSSLFSGINGSTIIDSTYNASPEALLTFLHLLTVLKQQTNQETVLILGDMRELGEHAAREHEALADRLVGMIEHVYAVGELTKEHVVSYLERQGHGGRFKTLRWFRDSRALGAYVHEHLPERALVLAKGSQNTIFLEETVALILRNEEDRAKLCRQEPYWQTIKKDFFAQHSIL